MAPCAKLKILTFVRVFSTWLRSAALEKNDPEFSVKFYFLEVKKKNCLWNLIPYLQNKLCRTQVKSEILGIGYLVWELHRSDSRWVSRKIFFFLIPWIFRQREIFFILLRDKSFFCRNLLIGEFFIYISRSRKMIEGSELVIIKPWTGAFCFYIFHEWNSI